MITIKIVEFAIHTVLIEYTLGSKLERRWIPRSLINTSRKESIQIPNDYLNYSIEYSDVSLINSFGKTYKDIQVNDLEQAFRKAGLWTKEDYRIKPNNINLVLQLNNWKNKIDVATVLNSVFRL